MDENGEQFVQEDDNDNQPQAEEAEEEPINTVHLDERQDTEDYSEADFVPHPFLGVPASN